MGGDVQQAGRSFDADVRVLVDAGRPRDAANLLVARLSSELRPFLHRLLGDVALADEAHSATCERLWRGLANFRWESSLRSWTYIIARREASRCRARYARSDWHTTLSAAEAVAIQATSRSLSTTQQDIVESLRLSLSPEDRDLLVLRIERGLSWKEIAAAFLEDDETDAGVLDREAARLRQRFRSIRTNLKAALVKRNTPGSETRGS